MKLINTDRSNVGGRERLASLLVGGLMVLYGLSRPLLNAVGLILAGGYFLYRGLSGYCLAYKALGINTLTPRLRFDEEYNKQPETTIDTDDLTDEAMWETFPASDPPASW